MEKFAKYWIGMGSKQALGMAALQARRRGMPGRRTLPSFGRGGYP